MIIITNRGKKLNFNFLESFSKCYIDIGYTVEPCGAKYHAGFQWIYVLQEKYGHKNVVVLVILLIILFLSLLHWYGYNIMISYQPVFGCVLKLPKICNKC